MAVIISREIVYDGTRIPFPTSIRIDSTGYAAISVQNKYTVPAVLGLYMIVMDPDGGVRSESNLISPAIQPNGIHSFEGGSVSFFQTGRWTINVELYVKYPNMWELIDQYSGDYCTVIKSESFRGRIIDMRFVYNGKPAAFGSEMDLGTSIQVKMQAKNEMETPQKMGMYWVARNPKGGVAQEYILDYWNWPEVDPGLFPVFTGLPFTLNAKGVWTIGATLLMNPASPIPVDTFQGTLVSVVEVPIPPPPPDEEAGFPWIPVALGAGGIIILATAIKKKT